MDKKRIQKDVVIVGAGMAGLTAAIYAGRANRKVLVLENSLVGGQIANTAGIENYPGFLSVAGGDLMGVVQQQAEKYGATVDEFDNIERLELTSQPKLVETESAIYEAKAVILASGMNRRKLPLPEAPRYDDKGIHYCELCDGHLYQNKIIAVAGGGNAAIDAAYYLTKYAKKLYVIHRSQLRADKTSVDRLLEKPNVEILLETDIVGLEGEGHLERVRIHDKATGEDRTIPVDGIFVNIGVIPNTELFKNQITLGPTGRIESGEDCRTNIPGVFAAGDIREKEIRQLTTAASDGTTAGIHADEFIQSLSRKESV